MKYKFLSQEHLKLIACCLMLLDHIGCMNIIPGLYSELRVIGRLAFPIFCFLLCEGFAHTKSKKWYLARLAISAVVSEIPFDLMLFGRLSFDAQNVMVTLFLGLLMAACMEKTDKTWLKVLLILPFYAVAELVRCDYQGVGILMIAIFLLVKDLGKWTLPLQTVLLFAVSLLLNSMRRGIFGIVVPIQIFSIFAMVPIALYNGRKLTCSPAVQWSFYLFYPVHMAFLSLLW